MNIITKHLSKVPVNYIRIILGLQRVLKVQTTCFTTSVDTMDLFTSDILQRRQMKEDSTLIRYFTGSGTKNTDITSMTNDEVNEYLLQLMSNNHDKQVRSAITQCTEFRKFINITTMKLMMRNYSSNGRPDIIEILQKYCCKVDPIMYKRNGEYMHYLAKAQCLKGNSEKGLAILEQAYLKNSNFKNLYRIIFKDLIHDSVQNRSEASLVIFRKYVMEFSEVWHDHYPLVCLWHICWSGSWFSDQTLANELLECSVSLQEIVRDRAIAFSSTALRQDFNEDAVIRLLQSLLKYNMMEQYVKVLQILFAHKLRNRDLRGCTEILRNCETLGITLPSNQQGMYINMLIKSAVIDEKPTPKLPFSNFKLKF